MAKMEPYDCEKLPRPAQIPFSSYTISDKTWDPFNNRWHDDRPETCRYPDCVLIHGKYRDGRPPRQCPIGTFHLEVCKHVEAQKEWRTRRREKRLMARLDRFLLTQEPLADLDRPGPFRNHKDYIEWGATPIYRNGQCVAYQWPTGAVVPGFPQTVEDA